ncbi:PREDICTED: protein disulfide-isomerase 1-like [Amphimedon queenslandica]|uniref:Thioredoxin domain-containing protein n=1 Tax=Amphimedon queenslandica TaxID=400682 RepID=A0AAN0JZ98_AMPQE|nr:PREDICTED: protein disulfide-isomerase 1-like [Amphimedon queenslandica]|eukprot:XP_019862249.1 PREDICTED: protein disulfide-isomerase 1-like [Amphimedon queenslandica]
MAVVSHSLGLIFILFLEFLACNGDAEFLSRSNMEQFKAGKKLMLINFYADWCRYSAALKPVYDKAADQVAAETVSITFDASALSSAQALWKGSGYFYGPVIRLWVAIFTAG